MHLFDALVIVVSFIVTIVLHGPVEDLVALFIFLRLWRVFRIIDSVVVTMAQEHDAKVTHMAARIRQLEHKVQHIQAQVRQRGAHATSSDDAAVEASQLRAASQPRLPAYPSHPQVG